ncbi:MAG: RES family NAD+ phosphorylase [Actinomycetota bacterium]
MLYRLFPWTPQAGPEEPGGALHVPRFDQGRGRHDNPATYGALYLSRSPTSPIAELLREYLGRPVEATRLLREGSPVALATIDDDPIRHVLDLDQPANLVARDLRPSGVATRLRRPTQRLALRLYEEGVDGFEWWSTIEASWINVTLFADRAAARLSVAAEPEPITLDHPAVREAAEAVGVLLG